MELQGEQILQNLCNRIVEFDVGSVEELVRKALEAKIPVDKVLEAMSRGMEAVGSRFENGEYFITELIAAAEAMKAGVKMLEPHLEIETIKYKGTIVVGSVEGDLHDIGKNIFVAFARSSGFCVYDLGVDVSDRAFVNKIQEVDADILGMSALTTMTSIYVPTVVESLRRSGSRHRVKVIVGGAAVTPDLATTFGADGYAKTAVEGVRMCRQWIEEKVNTK